MKYIRPLSQTSLINDANLVSYWTLDGNANDYKNVNNGTSSNVVYGGEYAVFGQGGNFNGTGSKINVTDSATLRPTVITISAWIYKNTGTGQYMIFDHTSASPWYGYTIYVNTGKVSFEVYSNGANTAITSTNSISDSVWTHVAGVYDGTYMYLYVNGMQAATPISKTGNITYTITQDLAIGTRCIGGGNYFPGNIDDISIFNRALSAVEISNIFAGESFINNRPLSETRFSGDTSLVSYWKLDGNSTDSKGTNNGTDTAITYGSQYGVFSQGANFNGVSSSILTPISISSTSSYSISFWFNSTGTNASKHIFEDSLSYSNPSFEGGDTNWTFYINNVAIGATGVITPYKWYHVVGTWNEALSIGSFYLNGTLISTNTTTTSNNISGLYWGCRGYLGSSRYFSGNLDDIAVFNKPLGAAEVSELYEIEKMRYVFRPLSETKYIDDPFLVSYWKLNGNSNDSKSIYNLTNSNVTYANAGFSQSAAYNGTTSISTVSGINYQLSKDTSFSCWIKINSFGSSGYAGVFMSSNVASYANYYKALYTYNNAGTTTIQFAKYDGTYNPVATVFTAVSGVWYHVVGVQSGKQLILYVNGVAQGASVTDTTTSIPTYNGFTVGGQTSQTRFFNGYIQDAAVFNRALNADEVLDIYQLQIRGITAYSPKVGLYGTSLISDANLVSYWKLDGNSLDYNGTYNGTDTSMGYGKAFGIFGQGAAFNGSTSLIAFTNSAALKPSGAYTISQWVKVNAKPTASNYYLFNSFYGPTSMGILTLVQQNTGLFALDSFRNGTEYYILSSTNICDGNWHHVVGMYDGTGATGAKIYVDGNLEKISTSWATQTFNTTNYVRIGAVNVGGTNGSFFYGNVDDVSIFSRALTAAEVKDIYNKGIGDSNIRPLESISSLRYDSSLLSYWKLDGNSNDSKGSNNGTAASITYGIGVNGLFNNSAIFNGSSSYINYGDVLDINTGDFTVNCWIKINAINNIMSPISKSSARAQAGRWGIYFQTSDSTIHAFMEGTTNNQYDLSYSYTSINDGKWHLINAVYIRSSNLILYIDGFPVTSISISGAYGQNINGVDPLYIGAYGNSTGSAPGYFFNGLIDDVSIFNRALTAAEIQTLYNGQSYANNRPLSQTRFSGDTSLVSYWKLDGNSNDSKGSINGTDSNVVYGSQYGLFTQGANFNGSNSKIISTTLPTTAVNNFTISLWVYPLQLSVVQMFIHNGRDNSTTDGNGYGVGISNGSGSAGSKLTVLFSGVAWFDTGYVFPSTNNWYYIVVTRRNGTTYVYVNGVQTPNTSTSVPTTPTEIFTIGSQQYSGVGYLFFNGNIDDVSIFNRALSIIEIQEIYELQKTQGIYRPVSQTKFLNDDNLISYWKLDSNSNDSKGNNNGTDTSITYIDGLFTKSALLNGSSSKIQLPNSIINRGGSFSIWIKTTSISQGILGMQDVAPGGTANWYVTFLGVTTTGAIKASWGWQNTTATITSTKLVNDGQWHHLVITGDGLITNLYIDSIWQGTYTASVATAYNVYINIGVCMGSTDWGYSGTAWYYFNGLIDDATLFSRALSRDEVAELYQSRVQGEYLPMKYQPQGGLYTTSLISDANLVSYWKLDGNSNDNKSTNNGTDTSMTYGNTYGKFGQGANFNGSTSKINLPALGTFTTISISFWIKTTTTAARGDIIIIGCYPSPNNANLDTYIASGKIGIGIYNGSTQPVVNSIINVNDGNWHHVAFTRNGATGIIYIDGIINNTSTSLNTGTINSIQTGTFIGSAAYTSSYMYSGSLDDVSIFNRVLTASEIFEIYSKGESSLLRPLDAVYSLRQDSSLVSYWKLNSDTVDSKGSNNGTPTAVTYGLGVNGRFGQCGIFNGSSSYVDCGNSTSFQIGNVTISAWIKTSGAGSSHRGIVVKQSAYGMFLLDNVFCIYDWTAGASRTTGVNLADGLWHHVAVAYQSGVSNGTILYIDGITKLTALSTVSSQTKQLVIGNGGSTDTVQYFNGYIDDVSIFNRTLSSSEVYQLYSNGQTVGYWKLNGSSTDYSGKGYNGTDTSMLYVLGLFDKCGVFNGTTSLILTNLNPSTTLGQNFTISSWIYPTAGSNYRGVAGNHYGDASTSYGIVFCQYQDGSWYFGYGTNSVTFPTVSTNAIINNQWNHVLAVYKGSSGINLYVNGVLVNSMTSTLAIYHTTSFWIGKAFNNTDRFFQGYIEEFIIETKIWSANDVKEYYTNKIKGLH